LQAPDENSHFGYGQLIAERFELPGKPGQPVFSTEQRLAEDRSNSDQTAAVVTTKPEWSEAAYNRWRRDQAKLAPDDRADGGGANPASTNPPLYYLYEAPAYLVASGGDVLDRLYLMRLWSVLLLLVTCAATWLLAGELFGPRRLLQLSAAALAGLQPMVTFVSASVNPDALLLALWSLGLWLGARVLRRGLEPTAVVSLCAVAGLAVLTKATGYALLPAVLVALGVAFVRARRAGSAGRAAVLVAALLAFAVPVGGWLVTAKALDRPAVNQVSTAPGKPSPTLTNFNVREAGSYMWQFYLPKLSFQKEFGGMPDYPVYGVWIKTGWAAFGWLEVRFPNPVYLLLAFVTLAVLVAAAVAVLRRRRQVDWAIVAFFGVAALTLLAGLHWTEFRTLVGGTGPFNQGRYLLPLISLGGTALAAALTLVPRRRLAPVVGVVLGGLVVLQVFSLAIVAGRFYA
jgi:hypothetical protein